MDDEGGEVRCDACRWIEMMGQRFGEDETNDVCYQQRRRGAGRTRDASEIDLNVVMVRMVVAPTLVRAWAAAASCCFRAARIRTVSQCESGDCE